MDKLLSFLKESRIFYLATIKNNDTPEVRPFGVIEKLNNNYYFCSGIKKNVVKQIEVNPKVGVSATNQNGEFCKVNSTLVIVTDKFLIDLFLTLHPELLKIYQNNLNDFVLLQLTESSGQIFYQSGVYQINA